jgi:hypothetical protein
MLAGYHTGEVLDSVVAGIPAVHSPGKLAGTPLVDCIPVEAGHHLGVAVVHIVHLVGIFLKLPDFNDDDDDDVYSIQHYVIKFIGDIRQFGGFLWVFRFPPPVKLIVTI